MSNKSIAQAANLIYQAKAILVIAGAGIGVDSGLPDFRGKDGFWKAYPPLKEKGLSLPEMVCISCFLIVLSNIFFKYKINLQESFLLA